MAQFYRAQLLTCIAFKTDDGIYFNPVYVADNSMELKAHGGWPDQKTVDLVASYDPEQVIVLIFERKDRPVSTMFMGIEDVDYTPKRLYETGSRHSQ